MKKFETFRGIVAPLDRSNVDTDAIIPKQFLKSIKRSGFGPNLFDAWRYLDNGEPGMDNSQRPVNPDFVLNQSRYKNASVLLARKNFGCGSSREHAPWALQDFGIRVIIAPSFADIFYNNCFKNGLLPVVLEDAVIDTLFNEVAAFNEITTFNKKEVTALPGYQLEIDLKTQSIKTPSGAVISFDVDAFRKDCLLHGLDDIGLTLQHVEEIKAYEHRRQQEAPWLF
ncbi:MAG: 3-isopropylmalate dehydratase small subunit [Gammaproteobacteria bacterium]|nr:3-isopropylmalate dehydratase small subunit [Gammaproteobacteria bacterium]